MAYYKASKKEIALMSALYDCQQIAVLALDRVAKLEKAIGQGPGVSVTRHWAQPMETAEEGVYAIPKPKSLECGTVFDACDVELVDSVEWPEPEEMVE